MPFPPIRCFQWFKDTNLKANHNIIVEEQKKEIVVFNGSKILIWKQITTQFVHVWYIYSCFQWFKDTNLKANHNKGFLLPILSSVVFNGSKILIWKQITTAPTGISYANCCFQWFKDTNLKANHNSNLIIIGLKITKWEYK